MIQGIEAVAAEQGYSVEIDAIAENPAQPRPLSLNFDGLSGVIAIANVLPDAMLRQIHASKKPLTLISHDVSDTPIPAVIADNAQGMALLVRHMIETCGRQRIVFVRGDMGQSDGSARAAAFEREMMRYNCMPPPEFILNGDFKPTHARAAVARLLQTRTDFDAIIAADYLTALAAWDALRAADIRVPDTVQIAGFGDGIEAETAGLTTVAADVIEQGRRGMRQLIAQIDGVQIRGVTVLKTYLVARNSTRLR